MQAAPFSLLDYFDLSPLFSFPGAPHFFQIFPDISVARRLYPTPLDSINYVMEHHFRRCYPPFLSPLFFWFYGFFYSTCFQSFVSGIFQSPPLPAPPLIPGKVPCFIRFLNTYEAMLRQVLPAAPGSFQLGKSFPTQ